MRLSGRLAIDGCRGWGRINDGCGWCRHGRFGWARLCQLMLNRFFQPGKGAVGYFHSLVALFLEPMEFVDQPVQCFPHANTG